LVKRLRLPRRKANDGKTLVSVDLSEINHKPMTGRSYLFSALLKFCLA